jgi:hypothetical protein
VVVRRAIFSATAYLGVIGRILRNERVLYPNTFDHPSVLHVFGQKALAARNSRRLYDALAS